MLRTDSQISKVLFWPTVILMLVAIYAVFVYVPNERVMGYVQRIFYFHVASAWVAFLAFFVVFIGGVGYVLKRQRSWDVLAVSAAEIGVVFTTIALITGSIWGRFAWGTWWTWDPRLSTTLVLWLIYVSYLMLRGLVDEEEQRGRLSAVFGIVGFVDVPIVFMAIRWWRTVHPVVITAESIDLDPRMIVTLILSVVTFTFLFFLLLPQRVSLENARIDLE
ncbi:MAG: cytochrome c biogenesis protein CcsA, partial [Chloroflexi bacterium]|nr:cytochrome c biogenesis protein CcsA [Chloroflexota bacterium]